MNSRPRCGSRVPHTDQDMHAAVQDFLKRIPSSNSLAAFGGQGGSQSDLAAQAAQLHSLQANLASQAAAALQSTSAAPDANGATGSGVPRVASLDFFRQLLPVNQLNVSGARPAAGGTGAFRHGLNLGHLLNRCCSTAVLDGMSCTLVIV
jgi:hypothetical protein